jgi:D-lactate dehydrogenase
MGVRMVALRCAGFDRVDMRAALAYGFTVARVPAYSPYAVAEHAASLLMAVNRKIAKASARVKMANFTLDGGLMGMDIHGKSIGVMGTGKIGQILCEICLGFTPAKLLCYDVYEADSVKQKGGVYVSKEELYRESDIIFLMMPLLPATYHAIDDAAIELMKPGVILVNTSRGGLVDTAAVLRGLQSGKIGGVGMDVYEHEQQYFFQDWSARTIADTNLVNLLGQHNVVLTAHQAFFTKEAVDSIVDTTLQNLLEFANGKTGFNHPNNCIPDPNKK